MNVSLILTDGFFTGALITHLKKIISVVISTMETNQANKERTDFIGFFAEIVHILEMKINIGLKCMCFFMLSSGTDLSFR